MNVGTCGLDTVERQSEHGTQATGKTDPTIWHVNSSPEFIIVFDVYQTTNQIDAL